MTERAAPLVEPRRYRAPREDRTALVEPPFERVAALVASNRRCRGHYRYDFHGRPLAELAAQARDELLAAARRWTAQYRDVPPPPPPDAPLLLAGHQPQLFHPGVWFKNFALGRLAERLGGAAVNLVVDSDTMKSHVVRVPGGTVERPHATVVPLDSAGPVVPFEERRVIDRDTFLAFGRRAAAELAPLLGDPLLVEYWPLAAARLEETDNLGECLAQSRHQLEGRWGNATLELPQSRVCQLPAFAWFAAHLFAELPRFLPLYNASVGEYRQAHGIRSAAHPVPDLAVEGEWCEAPFWIWTAEDPRRRRLFVRPAPGALRLTDRQAFEAELPFSPDGALERAAERLLELGREGVKIRSRALATTLWARLALGDLFLHGIGGAKYDQVTDALAARFFDLRPPGILVLSATLQLPIAHRRVTPHDARDLDRRLRELTWRPEAALDGSSAEAEALAAAKRRWIATTPAPGDGRTRWREIRRINEALQPYVADRRAALEAEKSRLAAALRAEAILASREYAFCLYPGDALRDFLFGLLPASNSRLSLRERSAGVQ